MTPTRHQAIEEKLAAYVMNACDPSERSALSSVLLDHLASCESCRRVYEEMTQTAGDLALAVEPARVSREFEASVMAAIADDGARDRVVQPLHRSRRLLRVALAAAMLAIAALGGAYASASSHSRAEALRANRALKAVELTNDPSATHATLKPNGSSGVVLLHVSRTGNAVLIGMGLPSIPSGRVLELWLMKGGTPVGVSVFAPSKGVTIVPLTVENFDRYHAAAITIEPGPHGSDHPTSNQIYSTSLSA